MPINQSFKCSDLTTNKIYGTDIFGNSLNLGNVNLSSKDRYINVKDNTGKDVFWVDENGANISSLETKTDFVSLTDTTDKLGDNNSVVVVKDTINGGDVNKKLNFTKDLEIESLKTKNIKCEKCNIKSINTDILVGKSVLGDNATIDKIHSDEIVGVSIKTGDLIAKKLKCDNFKTDLLEVINNKCERIIAEEIQNDTIISKNINGEKANIGELESQNVHIINLQANQTNGGNGNFDKGSFNELETVKFSAIHLKSLDAKINELEVERLITKYQEYGTFNEPLFLAITRDKSIELNSPQNYHKIITRVPVGVKTQSFTLENINVKKDWKINVNLTKDNEVGSTLIIGENNIKVNLSYKKLVEDNTLAIIYLSCL